MNFNTEQNPSLIIPKHVRTIESAAQDTREKTVLAAIYTSAQHIPSSPGEPDEFPDPNIDTRIIPLEDVNSPPTYNNNNNSSSSNNIIAPTPTPPTIHPEMITPATLSAAAAIAAAMDTTYSLPPQRAPMPAPPAPAPAPVVQAPVQPEISNHTVEAMLKNNPG